MKNDSFTLVLGVLIVSLVGVDILVSNAENLAAESITRAFLSTLLLICAYRFRQEGRKRLATFYTIAAGISGFMALFAAYQILYPYLYV
jgi:hypothetical protein